MALNRRSSWQLTDHGQSEFEILEINVIKKYCLYTMDRDVCTDVCSGNRLSSYHQVLEALLRVIVTFSLQQISVNIIGKSI